MRARALPMVLMAAVTLTACGKTVTVQVLPSSSQDTVAQPAADVPVEFLPYDRDSIFDALAAKASAPEPQVPEDLQQQKRQVADLNQEWHQAEDAWGTKRDSLEKLSEKLQGLDRRDPNYLQLYKAFNSLDSQVSQLQRQKNQLFARFDSLQKLTIERSDSMKAVTRSWENDAFSDYGTIVDSILKARGKEVKADTTGQSGYATAGIKGDHWYAYARYELPFEELYWNVRIDTVQGDTLKLTRDNAEVRLKM